MRSFLRTPVAAYLNACKPKEIKTTTHAAKLCCVVAVYNTSHHDHRGHITRLREEFEARRDDAQIAGEHRNMDASLSRV